MSDTRDSRSSGRGSSAPTFGARLRDFKDLMKERVRDVILVSSRYDSFILSEDGQIEEVLLDEFHELNLRSVPGITHVSRGAEALELARSDTRFGLIISSLHVADMSALDLAVKVRDEKLDIPVVVLGYDNRELKEFAARHDISPIEKMFLWQGDARILLAIIKSIEDRKNLPHDTGVLGVPLILVVEDNIRFYSSFLPSIYTVLMKHSLNLITESMNISHRLLRLRARPKIFLAQTYEEAMDCFMRYKDEILGVISDIEFPRRGEQCTTAGLDLAREIRCERPDIAIILQSSKPANEQLADIVSASFLLKDSPMLLRDLGHLMEENFSFGDFVFRLPNGTEIDRASDLRELLERLKTVPIESIVFHGQRNHFSNWLKARTEFELAHHLRPRKVEDVESVEALRDLLVNSIQEYRRDRQRGIVADFQRSHFDLTNRLSRIGGGSLGGKARGLAFAHRLLHDTGTYNAFEGIEVEIPTTVVLGTDVFDEFLEQRDLRHWAMECPDDREINDAFAKARIPKSLRRDMASLLSVITEPLAVRSSSLLEDAQYQPLAGVYETIMIPNTATNPRKRLEALLLAIKRVYASTFHSHAKAFLRSTPYRLEEEKMAVILQRIVGARHGKFYYPHFSGVARSRNFYPAAPLAPEDGIAAIALGMCKTVVDGERCVRFSPSFPQHLVQFSSVRDILTNSQRSFWALPLDDDDQERTTSDGLVSLTLDVAEKHGTLNAVGSTYVVANDAIYDGISRSGVRLVTLAPMLKHGLFPLPKLLERLLDIGSESMSTPVEIEFAANLSPEPGRSIEFGFLQMRPLSVTREAVDLNLAEIDKEDALCFSRSVFGHGEIDTIEDAVVVDYHCFDRSKSIEAARDVAKFNHMLSSERRPYLLIGVGRWGSADPWLGIPVTWDQIDGASVIVEAGFRDFQVTPSQGTHFFQNLTSCNVGYFTINPEAGDGFIDWEWLKSRQEISRIGCFRHIRFDEAIKVKMDSKRTEGAIFKPGLETDTENRS